MHIELNGYSKVTSFKRLDWRSEFSLFVLEEGPSPMKTVLNCFAFALVLCINLAAGEATQMLLAAGDKQSAAVGERVPGLSSTLGS